MSNYIPDLTLTHPVLLNALFTHDNPEWTADQLKFAVPEINSDAGYNTAINVTIDSAVADIKTARIRYNRISLTRLFSVVECGVLSNNFTDGVTDIATIADEILQQYGVNVSVGFTVHKEGDVSYLEAMNANLAYIGRVPLVSITSLRDRVQLTQLDGFRINPHDLGFTLTHYGTDITDANGKVTGMYQDKPIGWSPYVDAQGSCNINFTTINPNGTLHSSDSATYLISGKDAHSFGSDLTIFTRKRNSTGYYLMYNPEYSMMQPLNIKGSQVIDGVMADNGIQPYGAGYLKYTKSDQTPGSALVIARNNRGYAYGIIGQSFSGVPMLGGGRNAVLGKVNHPYILTGARLLKVYYDKSSDKLLNVEVTGAPELANDYISAVKVIEMAPDYFIFSTDTLFKQGILFKVFYNADVIHTLTFDPVDLDAGWSYYPNGVRMGNWLYKLQ